MTLRTLLPAICLLLGGAAATTQAAIALHPSTAGAATFSLNPATPTMAACLPQAQAQVTIVPGSLNDDLSLHATGLPPFAGFDLFAAQYPHEPFGFSWFLTAVHADDQGNADAEVRAALLGGFGLAAGSASGGPVAASHLVLFFDDPRDADFCFAPGTAPATPFNPLHRAGPAVLATAGFPNGAGPLSRQAFAPPGLGVTTPIRGRSLALQLTTFTSSCSDPNGWTTIRFVDFRLTLGSSTIFWARLDRPAKLMYIYDAAGHRWLGGVSPGSPAVLHTAYADLHLADSKVLGTQGTTGQVVWSLTFSGPAIGQTFGQGVQVTDLRYQTHGWNDSGTWSVG